MKAITQHFIGTTEEWKAANPKLYNAVWGFEKTAEGKVYAKLGNGTDRWNDLKYFDTENIHGLIEKFSGIWEAIDAESVARTEADSILQGNIDSETEARTAADITLQENIDSEAEARTAADITLQENIDSETAEREAADAALREAITLLTPEGLDDIPARLNTLQENIDTEAAERKAADLALSQNIEELRAADLTLQNNIDAETEAREAADAALREAIEEGQGNIQINIDELGDSILERLYPVGSGYIQGINDPDPIDRGLPGQWEPWTSRAEQYRLSSTALPSFRCLNPNKPNDPSYYPTGNYAANDYVVWHLSGAGYEIFKANEAISNAPAQFNPVKWTKQSLGNIVDRRFLQDWLDTDFAIGHVIADGDYAGMIVSEVIALGGTFPSWEGGNRPTFNSGIKPDIMRELTGYFQGAIGFALSDGVFYLTGGGTLGGGGEYNMSRVNFSAARNVLTGPEFSPRNIPYRFFRRVA